MSRRAFPAEAYANGFIRVCAHLVTSSGAHYSEPFELPINYTEAGERGVLVDWSPEGVLDHIEAQLEDATVEDYELRARVDHFRPELEFDHDREASAAYHADLF